MENSCDNSVKSDLKIQMFSRINETCRFSLRRNWKGAASKKMKATRRERAKGLLWLSLWAGSENWCTHRARFEHFISAVKYSCCVLFVGKTLFLFQDKCSVFCWIINSKGLWASYSFTVLYGIIGRTKQRAVILSIFNLFWHVWSSIIVRTNNGTADETTVYPPLSCIHTSWMTADWQNSPSPSLMMWTTMFTHSVYDWLSPLYCTVRQIKSVSTIRGQICVTWPKMPDGESGKSKATGKLDIAATTSSVSPPAPVDVHNRRDQWILQLVQEEYKRIYL